VHSGGADTGIPGLYAVLGNLPLVSLGRTPARFAVLPALAVAILAGIGAATAGTSVARRWGKRPAHVAAVALAALLVFEYLPVPYPTIALPSVVLAEHLSDLAGDGAVLELPYAADASARMLFQTVHQRPIFGGYISREADTAFLAHAPVLGDLMRRASQPDILPALNPRAVLATYRVTAIVVYRPPYYRPDEPAEPLLSEPAQRQRVQQVVGLAGPTWEDATGAIYRVPPTAPVPVLALAAGWHAPEAWPGGWMRWTHAAADLRLDRPRHEPVTISFTAWSFQRPRTLAVLLDGRPLTTVPLTPDPRLVAISLPPGAGAARVTLHTTEGAETPASLGLGADSRPLALGIAHLQVTPS
jgi:hypothetical protein